MKTIGFFVVFAVGYITAKNIPKYDPERGPVYFEDFIKDFNKQYNSEEEKAKRYDIFLKKLEEINLLNQKSEHAQYGINQFSDLTKEEFDKMYKGCLGPHDPSGSINCTNEFNTFDEANHNDDAEDSFDWRLKGVVTAVKDQGRCGSCWACSAIGNVESVNAISTGKLIDLSVQQLVDCDKKSHGCGGGLPSYALQYLAEYGAIDEENYKYVGKDQNCKYEADKVAVKIKGCISFNITDEAVVLNKLTKIAPLSIAIAADGIQNYNGGIVTGGECNSLTIDHAVLIVGYGKEGDVPYWIVKNSWGPKWGENGYFRMQRGVNCLSFKNFNIVTATMK